MALGRLPHPVDEARLQALASTRAAVKLMPLPNLISSRHPVLLDGGGNWQGSVTALWTAGQDMVDASLELGVYSIS